MEPTAKISLVQQLKVVEACERLSTNLVMAAGASKAAAAAGSRGQGNGSSGSDGPAAAAAQQLVQDEELLAKYAKLLATLAGEVMDALKRIENGTRRGSMCLLVAWLARYEMGTRQLASERGGILQVPLAWRCGPAGPAYQPLHAFTSFAVAAAPLLLRSCDQFQHPGPGCE
jgi:hypothetical protein